MATTDRVPRVAVIGVGNMLLKDEGVGIHVAHALQEMPSPDNIEFEVVDGGTLPDAPLAYSDVDKLVIVDAVQGGGEPGTIYRFDSSDIELDNEVLTSLHQVSLLENLWMMERLGQKPGKVVIVGVEPEDMGWGLELSEKLRERIPRVIEVVIDEVVSGYPDHSEKGE